MKPSYSELRFSGCVLMEVCHFHLPLMCSFGASFE